MRILLLGEVSGVHRELRAGLLALGHEVVQAHSGDAYRQFAADMHYQPVTEGPRAPLKFAREIGSQLRLLPKMVGFDVVQFISPKFFYWRLQPPLLPWLARFNNRIVMVNVSCSSEFNQFMRSEQRSPCADCKHFDLKGGICPWESKAEKEYEEGIYRSVHGLVASHNWYLEPLRRLHLPQPLVGIPLPIDLTGIESRPPRATERLRVYYGETRHGFKGGQYIAPALRAVAERHPLHLEKIESLRLNFERYLQVLSNCDVLIDQANAAGMGMNGLYAMARGKVTLSGDLPEELDFLGAERPAPIVGIGPDQLLIEKALEDLLSNRQQTTERGHASRAFVEKHHDARLIAERYVAFYRSLA